MNQVKKAVNKLFDLVENCFSTILVIAMVIVLSLQVVFRYVFNAPLYWSEELARLLLIWSVFFGAAIAFRYDTHMSIDLIFSSKLPSWFKKCLKVINASITTVFCLVLIIVSIGFLQRMFSLKTSAIGISLGIVYLILPIFACISILLVWIKHFERGA